MGVLGSPRIDLSALNLYQLLDSVLWDMVYFGYLVDKGQIIFKKSEILEDGRDIGKVHIPR